MGKASPRIQVFLHPGQYFVGDARHRVSTLLGSCVAVTLWHAGERIGAMSHFLLPERRERGGKRLDPRYGRDALELMLLDLKRKGVEPDGCQAKLFGGGDMFPGQMSSAAIGRSNGEIARRLVHERGIRIASESLFGVGHRRIVFDIATGEVWARHEKGPQRRAG